MEYRIIPKMFFSGQMHPTIGFCSLQQACQSLLHNKTMANQNWFFSTALTAFLAYFKFCFFFWWRCMGIFAMCILLLLRTTWIILFTKSTVLIIYGTVKLCANGHNNSQQCWDLQCIVGRIQLIRLCKPCVMPGCGPNNFGRAVQQIQHCCATLWQSRNKWNVGSC